MFNNPHLEATDSGSVASGPTYLIPLIAVSVVAVIVIAVLAALLAYFIRKRGVQGDAYVFDPGKDYIYSLFRIKEHAHGIQHSRD